MLRKSRVGLYFLWALFLFSCNRNEPVCPPSEEFTAITAPSHPCLPTGEVEVNVDGRSGFRFKLNKGAFQTSAVFENVPAGKHQVVILNDDGCEFSRAITVDTIASGIRFQAAADILKKNCSQCHSGVNPQAGLDFTSACDILNHWPRI
ncbi:MAG: hypothetical protein ACKO1F_13820, partial [Flammeovirgaceae bacterium]